MFNKIKWAWQRIVRGYDDRVNWGFDSYFMQVMPELRLFCEQNLVDKKLCKLNPKRAIVYRKTIKLIDEWKDDSSLTMDGKFQKLLAYVGKNVGYYWD